MLVMPSIFVNKELQRVTRGALDDLSDKRGNQKVPSLYRKHPIQHLF